MPSLSVIRLGAVDGLVMTNAFVALAESISEGERDDTLVICHPSAPFANAGFHQEVEREIDLDYCWKNSIQIVRRVIGGGAIADGPWEQDYFFISSLDSEMTKGTLQSYYGRMLEPLAEVLRRLDVNAERQGLNDLAVGGRKISANGAVDIERARVLTGDILMDVNIDMMSGILKVPDSKFRDKMADSMARYLTSLREQLGHDVPRQEVETLLIEEFSRSYQQTSESALTQMEKERLEQLVAERAKESWIMERSPSSKGLGDYISRIVKIREGMFLCRHDHKAQKLVRVTMLVDNGTVADISISGDFFTVPIGWPLSRLEESLRGKKLEEASVLSTISETLKADNVTIMGAKAEDFCSAVLEAVEHPMVIQAD